MFVRYVEDISQGMLLACRRRGMSGEGLHADSLTSELPKGVSKSGIAKKCPRLLAINNIRACARAS